MFPRLPDWDDTEKSNREDFNLTKAKDIFLLLLTSLMWSELWGQGQNSRKQHLDGAGGINFLWSCDKLANGTSRVRDQKRLFFLSHPTALCPPLLLSQCHIPIHLFRVWFVSCRDVEESCCIIWNFPEYFLVFIKSSFYNQHCDYFRIHKIVIDSDCRTELTLMGTVLALRRKSQSWSHHRNGNNLNVHQ